MGSREGGFLWEVTLEQRSEEKLPGENSGAEETCKHEWPKEGMRNKRKPGRWAGILQGLEDCAER